MSTTLPALLDLYFHACNDRHLAGASVCFSAGAVVKDEGQSYQGSNAILQWLQDTIQKYEPKFEPVGFQEKGGKALVSVTVSGNFPGSPVELEFTFVLENSKITSLVIG